MSEQINKFHIQTRIINRELNTVECKWEWGVREETRENEKKCEKMGKLRASN